MKKGKSGKENFFNRLKGAMEESIAHSRGHLSLKTTVLPAPPPAVSARQVVLLRERYKMSQGVFAAALNVSPKTVQSWEQGSRRPNQAALRLLEIFGRQPDILRSFFGEVTRTKNGNGPSGHGRAARQERRPTAARRMMT
jgi:putative transcriptional regulator